MKWGKSFLKSNWNGFPKYTNVLGEQRKESDGDREIDDEMEGEGMALGKALCPLGSRRQNEIH